MVKVTETSDEPIKPEVKSVGEQNLMTESPIQTEDTF